MKSGIMKHLNRIICIVLLIVLAIMIVVFIDANVNHYTAGMQSDIASEALFSALMYERGTYRPDTWYMSSAIHLITVPNLSALIYPLTGFNLNLSMGIACSIMLCIMFALMYLYLRDMDFSVAESTAAVLIVFSITKAQSELQVMTMLYAMDYVSHFITLFIILLLYNRALRNGRIRIWMVLLSFFLAIINGIQGMHACLFCYLPLLAAEFLRQVTSLIRERKTDNPAVSVWVFVLTVTTLLTNKLSGVYNPSPSRNIRHAFEKLVNEVIPSVKRVMFSGRLTAVAALLLIMAVVFYVLAIVRLIRSTDREKDHNLWSTLVFPVDFFICLFMTTFTTSQVADRYYIMLIYAVAVGAVMMSRSFPDWGRSAFGIIVLIYSAVALLSFYQTLIVDDDSQETPAYSVYKWMRDNGYEYGYSTFEHANYITVMGNNTVKVRCVNNMRDMEGSKWLSDTQWYPPYKDASGETCYIVSQYMQDDFDGFLAEYDPVIVRTENLGYYTVYVLDHDYTVWER